MSRKKEYALILIASITWVIMVVTLVIWLTGCLSL